MYSVSRVLLNQNKGIERVSETTHCLFLSLDVSHHCFSPLLCFHEIAKIQLKIQDVDIPNLECLT